MTRCTPRRQLRAVLGIVGILLGTVGMFGLATSPASAAGTTLTGGGSSFGALEMQQWTAAVASNPYNLTVNFVTNSSGQGRSSFASGTYDYGMSDIPYPPDDGSYSQLIGGRCHGQTGTACFVYVPVTAGALAFPYNVDNSSGQPITNLELTPDEACKIFTGAIKTWGDPELVGNNSALQGNTAQITPVVRSDQAGESYVLSQYCIAKDPAVWNTFYSNCKSVQAGDPTETCPPNNRTPTSEWPGILEGENAQAINGADQTANAVSQSAAQNESAITYVAAGYAVQRGLPMASVENAAGKYVQPNSNSVSIALGYATPKGDGTFNLDFNGSDPGAYFPSTYSYILAQTTGFDAGKGATLGKFICYDLGFGQVGVGVLRYAPLNSAVVAIAEAAEAQIPGGIPAASCTAGAPGAPPPPNVKAGDVSPAAQAANGSSGSSSGSSSSSGGSAASSSGSSAGGATGAASGGTTNCASTTTSSTSTATSSTTAAKPGSSTTATTTKAATTTTTKAPATGATTTAAGATTTAAGATTTTSTTVPCTTSNTEANTAASDAASNNSAALAAAAAANKPGSSSLAPILEGAGLCIIVLAVAGLRRRSL